MNLPFTVFDLLCCAVIILALVALYYVFRDE